MLASEGQQLTGAVIVTLPHALACAAGNALRDIRMSSMKIESSSASVVIRLET